MNGSSKTKPRSCASPLNGIIKSAAEIGGALRLKLADAIHLASAMAAGCEVFITNDKNIAASNEILCKIRCPVHFRIYYVRSVLGNA